MKGVTVMKQTNVVTMLTENPNGVLGRIIALFGRHGVAIDVYKRQFHGF